MVPLESLGTVCYSHSIITMALSCIVSEIKRDGLKSRFFIPRAFYVAVGGGSRGSISIQFGTFGKTRMVWLLDSENCLIIRLAVLIEYRRVTDRRTDGQTGILRRHSLRYA